jgi:hypothetical protein
MMKKSLGALKHSHTWFSSKIASVAVFGIASLNSLLGATVSSAL